MEALAQAALAVVVATRGVESGTLAATRRRGAQLFRRQRWRLAALLLQSLAGVSFVDWAIVAVDVWPWAEAFRGGPRGARLTPEAAWYAVAGRLGSGAGPGVLATGTQPMVAGVSSGARH